MSLVAWLALGVCAVGDAAEHTAAFQVDVFSHRDCLRPQIDLNGSWAFRRDPNGEGESLGWHRGEGNFDQTVTVPGAPQAQGIGEPHTYQHTAFLEPFWMRRTFDVPALGERQRVWLRIGGILPAANVYVNGHHVGYTKSSRTQQRVDITTFAKPGETNLIAVEVCDLPEVRMDGLLEWNEGTQLWRGAYRPIACEIADRVCVSDCYVQTEPSDGTVRVAVTLSEPSDVPATLHLAVDGDGQCLGKTTVPLMPGETNAEATLALRDFQTWSPEHPVLYTLRTELTRNGEETPFDRAQLRFGMREIATDGTTFRLNGKPVFLRVYGEDHYYPDTLCLPADLDWYRPRLARARAYGFNAVKGCVETIPQDYLEAADEAGIMVIQEMPFGLSTLRANRYTIDERFKDYYATELDGLVRVSRNHAAVIAYSMSSELEFSNQTQESFDFFSKELPQQTRGLAPHALVIDCTGYVNTEDTEKGRRDTDFYASIHPKWMKEVLDEADMDTDRLHPLILHEYNWWSCYPDPADTAKYADAQLKPFWLDTLLETARANGQEDLVPLYRKNSQWLQALCRKDGVEYARRNADVEGFILWLLIDFGHWSEGLLDDFWNPKDVSAEEFLQSNGDTVILLAEEGQRCLPMGSEARVPLAVSHYGEANLNGAVLTWRARGGCDPQQGELTIAEMTQGTLTQAGDAVIALRELQGAYAFVLEVELHHDGRKVNANRWSFWAFPDEEPLGSLAKQDTVRLDESCDQPIPEDTRLVLADTVDEELVDWIEGGGTCVLSSKGAVIEAEGNFYGIYRTIPWNSGDMGNSGTVITRHSAMAAFPHEGMCDLPFVPLVCGYRPMTFEPLRPYGVEPIIRCIDHYKANRNLAYLMEFRVGEGKVLVTSLGAAEQMDDQIQARYLVHRLMDYARGRRFKPSAEVPRDVFAELFRAREDES